VKGIVNSVCPGKVSGSYCPEKNSTHFKTEDKKQASCMPALYFALFTVPVSTYSYLSTRCKII
jgi:hypothetical protein